MEFGEKVKLAREKLLLTQRELAKELGISYSTVALWETGKAIPQISSQRKFFDYCKKHKITF
jgi:transcriptional regulator with XRE-family HTH domain